MPILVVNRRLSLDLDRIKGFISEHIRGLIWIFNVSNVKDERACDLLYDILCLDPVTTRHFHDSSYCGHTAGPEVRLFGSGGQHSAHICGKCLTQPTTR